MVSSFTFAATANAVRYTGATPVFIDSDAATWNMSPTLLAEELDEPGAMGRLPAAVIVVDLYGQCADYDAIVPLCAAHGVPLVEDAAEALLSTYKGRPAGTLGASGIFSFNGNKIMTTSGGGAFLSPSSEVADRVRYLATQARRAGRALRARRHRLQLPPQQSVGGDGTGAVGSSPGDVGETPADQRLLPEPSRRCPRPVVHADRPVGRLERVADVRGVRRSGGARSGCRTRWRMPTSRAGRCGSRCTSSRCSTGRRLASTGRVSVSSGTGCASPAAVSSPTAMSSASSSWRFCRR